MGGINDISVVQADDERGAVVILQVRDLPERATVTGVAPFAAAALPPRAGPVPIPALP